VGDSFWSTQAVAEAAVAADLARADQLLKLGMEQVLSAAQVSVGFPVHVDNRCGYDGAGSGS
jgi:hypothetical protein